MARLIDADALLKSEIRRCGRIPTIGTGYINEKNFESILAESPAVDAVEVVRCKDCKRRIEKRWCYSLHTYNGEPVGVADDFFCAYGKRKSDG